LVSYQSKDEIERDLAAAFGNKLQPIRDQLKNRQQYARLAKLTEEPYKIKGGCRNADRYIRAKADDHKF